MAEIRQADRDTAEWTVSTSVEDETRLLGRLPTCRRIDLAPVAAQLLRGEFPIIHTLTMPTREAERPCQILEKLG